MVVGDWIETIFPRFSATNSIVFAQYFMAFFGIHPTSTRQTILALAMVTFALSGSFPCSDRILQMELIVYIVPAFSTKWSLRVVNTITTVKVLSQLV